MILLRILAVFIFSALLTGCDIGEDAKQTKAAIEGIKAQLEREDRAPCPFPGGAQPKHECYYVLTITNLKEGWVTGKVADRALRQNKRHNPKKPDYPPFESRPEYTFRVQGSPALTPRSDYTFDGVRSVEGKQPSYDLSCRTPCKPLTDELPY